MRHRALGRARTALVVAGSALVLGAPSISAQSLEPIPGAQTLDPSPSASVLEPSPGAAALEPSPGPAALEPSPEPQAPAATSGPQILEITPLTVGDFGPVTLDGSAKTRTASISPFSVTDSRVPDAGWSVTVSATQFQRWDGTSYVAGNPFPAGSLRMAQMIATPRDVLGVPPVVTAGPYLIDGASVRVASAPPVAGLGTFDFTHTGPLTLTVPALAYAGTYRSEVMVSVTSGP